MQIMIDICNKQKMKKITLEDNSKKKFTGNSIKLIYFRTMTRGLPYYTKFNFRSVDYLITPNLILEVRRILKLYEIINNITKVILYLIKNNK